MQTANKECCRNLFFINEKIIDRGSFFNRLKHAFKQLGFIFSDIAGVYKKDPALNGKLFGFLEVILYAGIWALFFHRIAYLLYILQIPFIPRLISQIARFLTGIEIHPGAKVGRGLFIDHGNGIVIGETARIGDNVLIFHQVTLGAKGDLTHGKRHPTVGDNVIIGAGAKIIGNITIGNNVVVGAGSVVLKNVDSNTKVAGNPAREIGKSI